MPKVKIKLWFLFFKCIFKKYFKSTKDPSLSTASLDLHVVTSHSIEHTFILENRGRHPQWTEI